MSRTAPVAFQLK
uniref:Uncharacterized protein n=1 Tax=Rhizophora mucronata TaxID=61149 RepID=A0A2P2PXQ5_RHIMU